MAFTGYAKYFIKPTTTTTTTTAVSPTTQTAPSATTAPTVASAVTTLTNNVVAARKTNALSSIQNVRKNNARTGQTVNASGKYTDITDWNKYARTSDQPTYDVDSALDDIYKQAKERGITIARPKKYGNSITDQRQAQKIVDEYLNTANSAISRNSAKSQSNAPSKAPSKQSSTAKKGGSANTTRVVNTQTSTKSSAPAPVKRGYYDGITPTQKMQVDNWNRNEQERGVNDAINPDWVIWRNEKLSGPEPAKYWKDAPASNFLARDESRANRDAEFAESQRQLAASYEATQKAAGTTHAKNTKAVTNNGKSASQIAATNVKVKPTTKATVVKAGAKVPSVSVKAKQVKSEPVAVSKQTTKDLMKINAKLKQTAKASIIPANLVHDTVITKQGASNPNSGKLGKTYQSSSAEKQKNLADYRAKLAGNYVKPIRGTHSSNAGYDAAAAEAKKIQEEYNAIQRAALPLLDANYKAINQITNKQGNATKGIGVRGQTVGISTKVKVNGEDKVYSRGGSQTAYDAATKKPFDIQNNRFQAKQGSSPDMIAFRTVDQVAKETKVLQAIAEAQKINPNGSPEYFKGVENIARRSQRSSWDLINEDISEGYVKKLMPDLDSVYSARDKYLDNVKVTVTQPGKATRSYTLNEKRKAKSDELMQNPWYAGFLEQSEEGYNHIRDRPVTAASQAALVYALGGVSGVGAGVASGAAKIGGKAVASKLTNAAAKKVVESVSEHVVGAALAGGMLANIRSNELTYRADTSGLTGADKFNAEKQHAKSYYKMANEFAIGGAGFGKGMKAGEKIVPGGIKSTQKLFTPDKNLANALPSAFDITRIPTIVSRAAAKVDRVTALKGRVKSLESSGKASDKATAKNLRKQINAIENQNKNTNVLLDMKMKNRADIKETAEIQAFDKELANLKSMKAFADGYMQPKTRNVYNQVFEPAWKVKAKTVKSKPNVNTRHYRQELASDTVNTVKGINKEAIRKQTAPITSTVNKLIAFTNEELTSVYKKPADSPNLIKPTTGNQAKEWRSLVAQAKHIEDGLKRARDKNDVLAEAKFKLAASKFRNKNGISTKKIANAYKLTTYVKKGLTPVYRKPSDLSKLPKLVASKQAHERMNIAIQAQRIENGLEKARVQNDVKAEVKFMAEAAKFRTKYGVSTKKASAVIGKPSTESLGSKRAKYNQLQEIHSRRNKYNKAQLEKALPSDITDVMKYNEIKYGKPSQSSAMHTEYQRMLKDIVKWKASKVKQSDVTDIVGHRRTPNIKVTARDIALFKSQFGDRYNINSRTEWKSLHNTVAKYNKEVSDRRIRSEQSAKKMQTIKDAEAAADAVERALHPERFEKPKIGELTSYERAHEAYMRKKSAKRESERVYRESPEYKELEETHFKAWEDKQRKKSAKKESGYNYAESPKFKQLQDRHFEAWMNGQRKKMLKREFRGVWEESPKYKAMQERHFEAWMRTQTRKMSIREARNEWVNSPKYKAMQDRHFEAWARSQMRKMEKVESRNLKTPKKIAAEETHYKAWERIQKAKSSKRAAKKQARQNIDVGRTTRPNIYQSLKANPLKDKMLEAKVRQAEAAMKNIDVSKFETGSSKKISFGKKPEHKPKFVDHGKEFDKLSRGKPEGKVTTSGDLQLLQKVEVANKVTDKVFREIAKQRNPRPKQEVKTSSARVGTKQEMKTKQERKLRPRLREGIVIPTYLMYGVNSSDGNPYEDVVRPKGHNPNGRGFNVTSYVNDAMRNIENINKAVKNFDVSTSTVSTRKDRSITENKQSQTTKPDIIVKPITANSIRIDSINAVKPKIDTVPRLDSAVKEIVTNVNKVILTSANVPMPGMHQRTKTSNSFFARARHENTQIATMRKKPKVQKIDKDKDKNLAKKKRTIFNKLGGLDSFFGQSQKTTRKATPKRKTIRRA